MENEENLGNKLKITIDTGEEVTIDVLDIIDSFAFNKTFIIYNLEGQKDSVYASILNEDDTSYSLDTITDPEEIEYINSEIDRVVDGLKDDNE